MLLDEFRLLIIDVLFLQRDKFHLHVYAN